MKPPLMKLLLFLISVFSTSDLITPLFIKENKYFLCLIKFDRPLIVKCFEITEGRSGQPVEKYERIFLKKSGGSKIIDSMEIDLSDKCSFDKKCSYSICFTLEKGGAKIRSLPFKYSSEAKNFVIDEPDELTENNDMHS